MIISILKLYSLASLALSLISLLIPKTTPTYSIILLLYGPLSIVANTIALEKTTRRNAIAIMNLILIAIFSATIGILERNTSILSMIMPLPFCILFTAFSLKESQHSSGTIELVRIFDLSIIALLICIAYTSFYSSFTKEALILPLSAIAAILIAIIIEKQGGIRRIKISSAAIISLTVIVAILLMHYAAAIGEGASYIMSAIAWVGNVFYSFFDWLFSHFPTIPRIINTEYIPNGSDSEYKRHDVLTSTIGENVFKIILMIASIIIALALLILATRSIKEKKRIRGKQVERTKNRTTLSNAIAMALRSFECYIKKSLFIRKNIDNALGIALWIERKLKKHSNGKRMDESYSTFISRISNEAAIPDLESVANNLDYILYSPDNPKPHELKTTNIRAKINKMLINDAISKYRIKKSNPISGLDNHLPS